MPGFAVNGDPPENLLSLAGHEAVNHLAAPFNLLDTVAHQGVDHTLAPFNLITQAVHNSLDHASVPNVNPVQVSSGERTAGSSGLLRSFSPLDVATMVDIHAPGSITPQVRVYAFSIASGGSASTGGLGFTPQFCQATGSYASDKGSSGYAYGTGGNQVAAVHDDGGSGSSTGRILRNAANSIYCIVTAFSSSGITIASTGGTWNIAVMVYGW